VNPEALPFDRIVVVDGGVRRDMSVGDFFKLPLERRIEHILSRQLEFRRGAQDVDSRVALRALRARNAV
jgi:hypothetical protein